MEPFALDALQSAVGMLKVVSDRDERLNILEGAAFFLAKATWCCCYTSNSDREVLSLLVSFSFKKGTSLTIGLNDLPADTLQLIMEAVRSETVPQHQ